MVTSGLGCAVTERTWLNKMVDDRVDPQLVELLGAPLYTGQSHTGVHARFTCPFCKRRGIKPQRNQNNLYVLYINLNPYKGWDCKRCEARGPNRESLYKALGAGSMITSHKPVAFDDLIGALERFESPLSDRNVAPITEPVDLPADYTPLSLLPFNDAWDYWFKRGFTAEDAAYYRVGIGTQKWNWETKTGYAGRLLIPDLNAEGTPVYWVGRSYRPNLKPRYRNPSEIVGGRVFHLERAVTSSRLIVVEGPLDAIAAGHDAVAGLGKGFTKWQIDSLVSHRISTFVVALDPDALKAGLDLCYALWLKDQEVLFLELPNGEDPASLGTALFRSLLTKAHEYHPWTISEKLLGIAV